MHKVTKCGVLLRLRGLFNYLTQIIRARSGEARGDVLFDRVLKEGGVWYLPRHSWKIEEFDLWNDLKRMLGYVSGREGVLYVSNSELLNFLLSCQASLVRGQQMYER
jgi:hypothetical protein